MSTFELRGKFVHTSMYILSLSEEKEAFRTFERELESAPFMSELNENRIVMHVNQKARQHSEPLVTTVLQLRICQCILKLAEVKEKWCGIMYKSEITGLIGVKFTTLESYLENLKKKGIIEYLPHVKKPEWEGGVLRLTVKGRERIQAELAYLLRFEDVDQTLKKIQPIIQ